MNNNDQKKQTGKRLSKGLLALFVVPAVLGAWVLYASYVITNGIPGGEDGSWSSEVLAEIHEGIITASPVDMVNACGLGASSCFKCHNGKRAEAPGPQKWHTEHAKVNGSCVGCHSGNQRLMVKNMAHRKLIVDPRLKSEETCMSCHKDVEPAALVDKYMNAE